MPGLLRQGKGKSMKKMMAVYDADTRYAERLSDYVNRKERGVFTAQAFTSKEKLAEYAAKHEIDVLLSGERTDSGDISEIPSGQKIYMSEETERQMESGKEIYKFQSGDDIIREVMAVYSEIPGIRPNTAGSVDQSRRIIGVYSPVGRCGKTCLALAIGQILAKEEKVLFVTLDTFTGFTGLLNERWKRDLSDLIYYYKQERFHIVRLNSLVYYLGDMAWIPPIRIPQDYAQLTAQEMANLMERILREGNYTTLVLDIGDYGRDALPLMEKCQIVYAPIREDPFSAEKMRELDYGRDALPLMEKCQIVYAPIREDPFSAEKMREFEEYLETTGNNAVAEKIQKIHVPMVTGGRRMEHFPQELLWGDMGDFVRSLLKGQRNLWDN